MNHAREARRIRNRSGRRRSCGKAWFPDRIAAELALSRIRARGRPRSWDLQGTYRCNRCTGWHLTSTPYWPRDERRQYPSIPAQHACPNPVDNVYRVGDDSRGTIA